MVSKSDTGSSCADSHEMVTESLFTMIGELRTLHVEVDFKALMYAALILFGIP